MEITATATAKTAAAEATAFRAKRGDLVAIVRQSRTTYASGRPEANRVEERVDLHRVTGITRDGAVRVTSDAYGCTMPLARQHGVMRVLVVPAAKLRDVEEAMAAAKAHTYEGSTTVRPFGSVDELRSFLRPFAAVA